MDCNVTCFERVMHMVKPLSEDKHKEAVGIIQELSFDDFLYFCVENNSFIKTKSSILYDGIATWENLGRKLP